MLISIDAKGQTFTVAELSPGPALCRTTLTGINWQITTCLLSSYILEMTLHLVWHDLLPGMHCSCMPSAPGKGCPKPAQMGGCSGSPGASSWGSSCPQPNESEPHSQDMEAHKAFCRKINDKKGWFWGATKLPCGASSLWKPVKVLFLHAQKILCDVQPSQILETRPKRQTPKSCLHSLATTHLQSI